MQIWMTLVLAVQILSALTMIGLVLVQHGKGADMGASFGGGSSGSLFGATGSANFLSRLTAACATVFFLCTLALAAGSHSASGTKSEGTSVLDRAAPVDAIPGATPAAAAASAAAIAPPSTPLSPTPAAPSAPAK